MKTLGTNTKMETHISWCHDVNVKFANFIHSKTSKYNRIYIQTYCQLKQTKIYKRIIERYFCYNFVYETQLLFFIFLKKVLYLNTMHKNFEGLLPFAISLILTDSFIIYWLFRLHMIDEIVKRHQFPFWMQ